jgi:hypothetical protein
MAANRESWTGAAGSGAGLPLAQPLRPPLLYRRCDPAELPFGLCGELEEASGLIGRDRTAEALNFALRMRAKGNNIYALGSGSGLGSRS